jgi:hypothetical protein
MGGLMPYLPVVHVYRWQQTCTYVRTYVPFGTHTWTSLSQLAAEYPSELASDGHSESAIPAPRHMWFSVHRVHRTCYHGMCARFQSESCDTTLYQW